MPIVIVPTAAVPNDGHARAGANGRRWFAGLGASDVETVPLNDRAAAQDPQICRRLARARLVFILGGNPGYLCDVLLESGAWEAMGEALAGGGVLAGSSAGAMFLCRYLYSPTQERIRRAAAQLPNACVLPHHDSFGRTWAGRLRAQLPAATLIGIDEETALISDDAQEEWTVLGGGGATIYRPGDRVDRPAVYAAGERLSLA